MKRIIALLVVLMALILMIGCDRNNDNNNENGSSTQNPGESVSTGDNSVDFNDGDGEESSEESTTKPQDNGETTTRPEWTGTY